VLLGLGRLVGGLSAGRWARAGGRLTTSVTIATIDTRRDPHSPPGAPQGLRLLAFPGRLADCAFLFSPSGSPRDVEGLIRCCRLIDRLMSCRP